MNRNSREIIMTTTVIMIIIITIIRPYTRGGRKRTDVNRPAGAYVRLSGSFHTGRCVPACSMGNDGKVDDCFAIFRLSRAYPFPTCLARQWPDGVSSRRLMIGRNTSHSPPTPPAYARRRIPVVLSRFTRLVLPLHSTSPSPAYPGLHLHKK